MNSDSKTLNQACAELSAKEKAFFEDAFTNPVTKKPYPIPEDLRRISERICRSYGICGSCDPMYIANIMAFELGLGDGQSNFFDVQQEIKVGHVTRMSTGAKVYATSADSDTFYDAKSAQARVDRMTEHTPKDEFAVVRRIQITHAICKP